MIPCYFIKGILTYLKLKLSELHEVQKGSKLDSAQERYRNRTLPDAQSLPKEIKLIEVRL